MTQWRCRACNGRLADVDIENGTLTIKCPRCNAFNTYSVVRAVSTLVAMRPEVDALSTVG